MDSTTGQEPAAELPDGWSHATSGRSAWLAGSVEAKSGPATVYAYPAARELDVSVCGPLLASEARTLAARLLQGAALVDGCRCPVAYPSAGWEMRVIDGTCPVHAKGA